MIIETVIDEILVIMMYRGKGMEEGKLRKILAYLLRNAEEDND